MPMIWMSAGLAGTVGGSAVRGSGVVIRATGRYQRTLRFADTRWVNPRTSAVSDVVA